MKDSTDAPSQALGEIEPEHLARLSSYRTVGDGAAPGVWSGGDRPEWGHPGVRDGSVVYELWTAGAVLRTARAYAGLSQRELAERTGLAQSTIARIEAGRTVARWSVVFRCVLACELTFALLAPEGEVIGHEPLVVDRDAAGRRYPAHLRVRRVGRRSHWWRDKHNVPDLRRRVPRFTFDRRHRWDPPDPVLVRRRRRRQALRRLDS
ncbi:helix-turn-helix domain-containing protein [Jiangella asiatica]|uniref:XRE family transcriptional regulator n=1 Tax=Jiangella asiatica TaxID=2530372 RepID=A0A4R5DTP5_9ACTN|nr:helix-turn-helix transcriptional regulator [Jiangella asiatica]TDE15794.1 XRE family transcriptional regulator [Jiangella asiatica]